MHRDLYMQALKRISELELDGNSLLNLVQSMQDVRMTMVRSKTNNTQVTQNVAKNVLSQVIFFYTAFAHYSYPCP